jgi:hypothetical protein
MHAARWSLAIAAAPSLWIGRGTALTISGEWSAPPAQASSIHTELAARSGDQLFLELAFLLVGARKLIMIFIGLPQEGLVPSELRGKIRMVSPQHLGKVLYLSTCDELKFRNQSEDSVVCLPLLAPRITQLLLNVFDTVDRRVDAIVPNLGETHHVAYTIAVNRRSANDVGDKRPFGISTPVLKRSPSRHAPRRHRIDKA